MSHHMTACLAYQGELAACACGVCELSSPLAEHLSRCPSCRSDFTAYMSATQAPPLAPHVRASIQHHSLFRRNGAPMFTGIVVGVILAALLLAGMRCGGLF